MFGKCRKVKTSQFYIFICTNNVKDIVKLSERASHIIVSIANCVFSLIRNIYIYQSCEAVHVFHTHVGAVVNQLDTKTIHVGLI